MSARYPKVKANQWVRPVMKGYRMACCDCGLVHELDFKIIKWGRGHKVLLRARRLTHRAKGSLIDRRDAYARLKVLRERGFKQPDPTFVPGAKS